MYNNQVGQFRKPLLIALALILPLVILQLINTLPSTNFPFFLFFFIWILLVGVTVLARSLTRDIAAWQLIPLRPTKLLFQGLILLSACGILVGVVADQMPCFLGAPNCD